MVVGFRIAQAKSLFFDRRRVWAALSKIERRVLSRFGAYVRQDAIQRIRSRKRPSRPGESPTSQTGLLKEHIYFAADPDRRSVVIGPARFNRWTGAPKILEHGGQTMITTRGRRRLVTIAPRPYMGPAFQRVLPQVPAMWRDAAS